MLHEAFEARIPCKHHFCLLMFEDNVVVRFLIIYFGMNLEASVTYRQAFLL